MLKLKNVFSNLFYEVMLSDINLSVNAGEIHAIIGPAGAGKTALFQTIRGSNQITLTDGSIFFQKKNVTEATTFNRSRNGMFSFLENVQIFDGITNFELIQLMCKSNGDTRNEVLIRDSYVKVLESLGLGIEYLDQSVNDPHISVFNLRKLELSQMLIISPFLLLIDNIDYSLTVSEHTFIANILRKYLSEHTSAALVISRQKEFLDLLEPTHVTVLVDGEIRAHGSRDLYERMHPDVYIPFS